MMNFLRVNLAGAIVVIALLCVTSPLTMTAYAQAQAAVPALEGLDPVALVQGKEVLGNPKITVTRGQFQYFFTSDDAKAIFEKDPDRYEIQLGGMCARMGAPVSGNPDLYTVHKGHIYIFGSGECKTRFEAAPEKYLDEGNAGRPDDNSFTPEAKLTGRELIERAVNAMGSPSLIDGLATLQERSVSTQTRHNGDVEIKTSLTFVYPDKVRIEQIQPDFRNPTITSEAALVMSGANSFSITPGGVRTLPDFSRLNQQQELKQRPLEILRSRRAADFLVASAGRGKVGDTEVEQVVVQIDGRRHTIGIDPSTGRIVSLSYRRRGPGGDFGDVTKVYSDFRTVDSLVLPFKVTATFNGQPWNTQSSTIASITINGKVDPALFEKPSVAKTQ